MGSRSVRLTGKQVLAGDHGHDVAVVLAGLQPGRGDKDRPHRFLLMRKLAKGGNPPCDVLVLVFLRQSMSSPNRRESEECLSYAPPSVNGNKLRLLGRIRPTQFLNFLNTTDHRIVLLEFEEHYTKVSWFWVIPSRKSTQTPPKTRFTVCFWGSLSISNMRVTQSIRDQFPILSPQGPRTHQPSTGRSMPVIKSQTGTCPRHIILPSADVTTRPLEFPLGQFSVTTRRTPIKSETDERQDIFTSTIVRRSDEKEMPSFRTVLPEKSYFSA